MTGAERARDHLTAIAGAPRPAGGPAEAGARSYCARVLRAAGFEVREEPFEYSAFPGRFATAAGGLASTLLLVAGSIAAARGRPATALVALAVGGAAIASAALWVARTGVVDAAIMRRRAVNLVAAKTAEPPRVWLVAHLDSKSQPVPMLLRAGGIALHGAMWAAALVLSGLNTAGGGASFEGAWAAIAAVGGASGLPIIASVVGDRSAGAVDDASGVAAVLLAAVRLRGEAAVGIVITSAEELGLAGARAWVRTRPASIALNCDGIDDAGTLLCMYSGRRPTRLAEAFERAARLEGQSLRVRRLLPGILVDGVAFADAGWEVLTLSRGSLATLGRIHTPRDNLAHLSGVGVEAAVPILVRVAQELC